MAQVYFHYSTARGLVVDQRGTEVDGMIEARDHAACVIRSLTSTLTQEDWRNWVLHVSDELGEEIFEVPFTTVIGRPH